MAIIPVIYRRAPDDSQVCIMGGVVFFDGQSVDVDSDALPVLARLVKANAHFDVPPDPEPEPPDDEPPDEEEEADEPVPDDDE